MLVSLGRHAPPDDLVVLLLECHQRIRRFLTIAMEVGRRADVPEQERIEACRSCERYFTMAFPLHVADEEQSVLPRLRGKQPALDQALLLMEREHRQHPLLLDALITSLRNVSQQPNHPQHRQRLLTVAERLAFDLGRHLAREEEVIFPAVSSLLTPAEQEQIMQELRSRRQDTDGS